MASHSLPSITMATTTSLLLILLLLAVATAAVDIHLASSDFRTLLRIRRHLEFPSALTPLPYSSLCSLPASPSLSLSCSPSGHLSSLHLSGNSTATLLSSSFSLSSLFTTLSRLPELTNLSLSSLGLWGPLPPSLSHFPLLSSLDLSSNHINGSLPPQLLKLPNLQRLDLSSNLLRGSLPNLSNLSNLQHLDLAGNSLSGAIPPITFSLPAIRHINLSRNAFSGEVGGGAYGAALVVVDVSENKLVGKLPACISSNTSRMLAFYSWNCLSSPPADARFQHPASFCGEKPLPLLPAMTEAAGGGGSSGKSKVGIVLGVIGGVAAMVGLAIVVILKWKRSSSNANGNMASADAKRKVEEVRTGLFGAVPYRVFDEEEVEEMTGGFDASNLLEEHSTGKNYRGWLRDGTSVTVKRLELKQRFSPVNIRRFTDVVSKLRHHHLVSILGHSVVAGDNGGESVVYLVFEHFSNGTLRNHLTDWRKRETLRWPQRVAAVIGVARGIQFLHTCGIHGSEIKMENIVMDEALTAKIANYAIPAPSIDKNGKDLNGISSNGMGGRTNLSNQDEENGKREDIYRLGLILLEVITGKSAITEVELEALKLQLQKILTESITDLPRSIDPSIQGTFMYESLRTMAEVALSCLSKAPAGRPSIDDVLWHLHYSIQVQFACTSSGSISLQSFTAPLN